MLTATAEFRMKLYEIISTWRSWREEQLFTASQTKTRRHQVTMRKADLEEKEVLSHTTCDLSVEFIATAFNGSKNYTFD